MTERALYMRDYRRRPRQEKPTHCPCGEALEQPSGPGAPRHYCPACLRERVNRAQRRRAREKRPHLCIECGAKLREPTGLCGFCAVTAT